MLYKNIKILMLYIWTAVQMPILLLEIDHSTSCNFEVCRNFFIMHVPLIITVFYFCKIFTNNWDYIVCCSHWLCLLVHTSCKVYSGKWWKLWNNTQQVWDRDRKILWNPISYRIFYNIHIYWYSKNNNFNISENVEVLSSEKPGYLYYSKSEL